MQFQEIVIVRKNNEGGDLAWQRQEEILVVTILDAMVGEGPSEGDIEAETCDIFSKVRGHKFFR